MIFCDTGPLVALMNRADKHHADCADLLEYDRGPLVIPALVVLEVCQVLDSRSGPAAEAAFLGSLSRGEFVVEELVAHDYQRMSELIRQYSNLPLGAADASVVAVAERLGISEVATLDRRHFSIVRPKHVQAFTLLPG
jgi:predicted nucleic acid-binding protein